PLLLGVLLVLLVLALRRVKADKLWPLQPGELPGLARGALVPVDLIAGAAAVLCFPAAADGERGTGRAIALWMLGLSALLTLLALAVTGSFGHELTAELSRPFFVLVRTLRLFNTLERMEAPVVMLWIFPDFLTASLFLLSGARCLHRMAGGEAGALAAKLGIKGETGLLWLCAAGAVALSLLISPDAPGLERWSEAIIPAANLVFCFGLLPTVYVIARARERSRGDS
ncbi:MAG: hypothetical protein K6F56_09635, partial [Oscillospiraceae bacterium]|nr:hypothetical protein [Oscillospiraceae bacterium]